MRRRLKGSRWVVTGASSGIGREVALQLARAGVRLLLTARRESRLAELVESIRREGGEADLVAGDLAEPSTRQRLVDWIVDRWGACDGLINNAGIGAVGPFVDASPQRLRQLMEINFFAPVELTRSCLPWLSRGDRPMVVNIGSVLGYVAVPDKSEYCATKFALRAWSESLGFELQGQIDVLLVSPSSTASEFFDRVIDSPADFHVNQRQMSADVVARQVISAMTRGRRELILSVGGRSLVRSQSLVPAAGPTLGRPCSAGGPRPSRRLNHGKPPAESQQAAG